MKSGGYWVAPEKNGAGRELQAKITKQVVDRAGPGNRDRWVWDTEVRGFGLRVMPSGRKSYVVEYRLGAGGRQAPKRRFTIGQHGSPWTPDSARKRAIEILADVIKGKDPVAERQEIRRTRDETVGYYVEAFIERYAKKEQKSWRETERTLQREFVPRLGRKKPKDVTRREIADCIDGVADRAPVMAHRTFAYVRRFFAWCVEQGFLETSPCVGMKPPSAGKARERVLNDEELTAIWRGVETLPFLWTAVFKLLILTGQRKNEVIGMEWSEVDLDAGLWKIPGRRTKNGRAHEVPLTPLMVEIIRSLPRIEGSPFVFTTTGKKPMAGQSRIKQALDATIERAESPKVGIEDNSASIPHWTVHDIRRTAATGMARLGVPPHVADALLNHKGGVVSGVAAVYIRYGYLDERRAALETWEAHVVSLLSSDSGGELRNVVR